jgi:SAM-dependent methyltransferase
MGNDRSPSTAFRMRRALRAIRRRLLQHGRFAPTRPLSTEFGFDRGTPIDRFYIEDFLTRHAGDISGRVLEIGDDAYSRRFGGDRIERQDILHVDPANPAATIVGDISMPDVLPADAFDCLVITQTLHLIYDMPAAVENLRCSLKPGGVALVTVPGITPVDRGEWGKTWYWSLTAAAARRMFGEAFGDGNVTVECHGNVFSACAFLQGAAAEEVDRRKLKPVDEAFPVTVAIRARR